MPPKLPSFQEWNVWITDLDERWNLKSEILAVLSPFTLILRRWRPQDPACHLQRWGRRKGCKGTELVKGTACLTSPVVASFVLKNPCVSSFLTQVCHGSPFSLKFFVVSLFGGLCRSDFCHDNQPLQVEERWAQGLVQHEREFKRSTLGRCCSRKKRWQILARWFGRFVVESLEGFWKDEVPFGLFTGKLYTILFWGIWKAHTLQRFQASPQEEYSDAFIEFLSIIYPPRQRYIISTGCAGWWLDVDQSTCVCL